MTAARAISIFVGVVLSVVLQAVPPVEKWWAKKQGKVLILLALHLGGAALIWLLDCQADLGTGVELVCNWEGLQDMLMTGGYGFVSNQTTYGLTNYAAPALERQVRALRVKISSWTK